MELLDADVLLGYIPLDKDKKREKTNANYPNVQLPKSLQTYIYIQSCFIAKHMHVSASALW